MGWQGGLSSSGHILPETKCSGQKNNMWWSRSNVKGVKWSPLQYSMTTGPAEKVGCVGLHMGVSMAAGKTYGAGRGILKMSIDHIWDR